MLNRGVQPPPPWLPSPNYHAVFPTSQVISSTPVKCVPSPSGYAPPKELAFHKEAGVVLNRFCLNKHLEQAFLLFEDDDGEVYHLWIRAVFPSLDGNTPKFRLPTEVNLQEVPCLADLGHIKIQFVKWPKQLSAPSWFFPRLRKSMTKLLAKQQEKKSREGREAEVQ
ncbi:hypothetical protein C8R44DRAFT_802747 [Mycena epipterygia]|nr:hypothetical protein C8R44DRAFT_802747 [Mycena epipterygia]